MAEIGQHILEGLGLETTEASIRRFFIRHNISLTAVEFGPTGWLPSYRRSVTAMLPAECGVTAHFSRNPLSF